MSRKCSVDECGGRHEARGYCTAHYVWAKNHNFEIVPTHKVKRLRARYGKSDLCSVVECINKPVARGYCGGHWAWAKSKDFKEVPTHILATDKRVDTSNWNRENLAWVAGIIEGEGCIGGIKGYKSGRITIRMTDLDVLETVKKIAGCGYIYGPQTRLNCKDIWSFNIHNRRHVYALARAIYPWLHKRRREKVAETIKHMGYELESK